MPVVDKPSRRDVQITLNSNFRPGRAWSIAALLSLFMLINFVDKIAIGLVAVPLMDEFKLTPSQYGVVASSFFWLFSISCVAGGFLANRFKAKWLLLGMAAIWALAQVPIIFAQSMAAIILARVILGIGEGPASPIAVHASFKWFPNEKRNLPVTVILTGATVGLLIAGVTIPQITARWGWRTNFEILAVIGVVWSLLWWVSGAEGTIEDQAVASKSAAVQEPAIPYRRLLSDPTIWSAMVLHFVAYWALALSLTWLPAYIQKGLGFDAISSGRLFGLVVATTVPINLFASWWSQRLLAKGKTSRVSRAILSSLAMALAGVLLLIGFTLVDLSPMQKVILLGIALGLPPIIYSLAPGMIAEVVPPSQRGAMLAIDNAIATLAAIIAPIVTGWLIQFASGDSPARGYEQGFVVNGTLLLMGALVGLIWTNPEESVAKLVEQGMKPVSCL
ncbi:MULTISPECIES: MFS transporter [Comamonas]|uniref:MFS transporter n=1 Tax=Comamonas TaxID=283 RepID=UPI0015FA3A83|nr:MULTISPECIES: MFS transporter [Comamonas]UUC95029.1 MFS transporter [Comamonas sp. C11]WEE79066.1 MFS transporter [Comamonas testosteroni]